MIIAVDFDGTIQFPDKSPNVQLLNTLRQSRRNGNTVILWTTREGKSLKEALFFCWRYGFVPDFVNQNAPQAIQMLGHDSRKIYADVYIDDKAVKP